MTTVDKRWSKEAGALAKRVMPNWKVMIENLPPLNERQVYTLIIWELANRKNRYMLRRLHQRFTRLRAERERVRLLDHGEAP